MKRHFLFIFLVYLISQNIFSQWIQTGGPNGGYTNEIVKSGSFLVLNAGNGGIYRSIDNGSSWTLSNAGLPCNLSVQGLVEHNGVLYVSISRSGIYMSTNNGGSWVPVNSGIENLTFYSLYAEGSNIYAGYSEGGAYYSSDNGISWISISNTVSDMSFNEFLTFNSKLYAGGRSSSLSASRSLFQTSDNGANWTPVIVPGIGANGVQSMVVKGGLFFVANDDTVFVSNDGVSWNSTSVDTNASIVSMGAVGNTVYLTTSGGRYYFSQDDGLTWTLVQNPQVNGFVNNVLFLNNKIIMTTAQGVYESFDMGTSWVFNNKGISALQIEALGNNSSFIFSGTENQGVFRTADEGQNWEPINNGLDGMNAYTVTDIISIGNDLFIATGGGVYKSNNNGSNWVQKFYPGINKSAQVLDYDNNVLATCVNGSGVYLSKDLGETWILASINGLNIDTSYDNITIKGNIIIVNTGNSETFISKDLGNSWAAISITSSFHLTNEIVYVNDKLYAATTRGLFISENLGGSWILLHSTTKEVYDVAIDEDQIYIATSTGVYVTTESDTEWYPLCEGLGLQYSNEIFIKDNVVYLGTFNSSVWKRFKVVGSLPPKEDEFTIGNEEVVLCPSGSTINLFDSIGISSTTEGAWSPNLSTGNGIFNPDIDSEGTYTFLYTNKVCGCDNYSKVVVSLDGLSAGNESSITLCLNSTPVNLFDALGENASPGGVWTPSLASGTGIFDTALDTEGVFTYTVLNVGCPDDSSEVQVFVNQELDSGLDGVLSICSNEPSIDLFSVLNGSPDSGGVWSPELKSGSGVLDPSVDESGVYLYTLSSGGCLEKSSKVTVNINKLPEAGESVALSICLNSQNVNLFERLNSSPDLGGIWSPELDSGTGVFNPLIDLEGIYTYTLENQCGIDTANVDVTLFDIFETPDYSIQIIESSNLNSIIVEVGSELQYEYSLDGLNFQSNGNFDNLIGGSYKVVGKEINDCGFFEEDVFLLSYPRFFSPNGDGNNDVWKVKGALLDQKYKVFIYDRYGKLLKQFGSEYKGWDGTFNGYPLPANDYWFRVAFESGQTKFGHFTLKR